MTRSYFRQDRPETIWHPASYMSRWFADQTLTPHIDEDDAYSVLFHKHLAPLPHGAARVTDLAQQVVPTLYSLLYGSILLHIFAGKSQQDFEDTYRQFQPRAPILAQKFPSQPHNAIELATLLLGSDAVAKVQKALVAPRAEMLASVMHLTWRYKPEQLVAWARAMLLAMMVLASSANVPDEFLKRILVPMAVVAVEEELP